MCASDPFHSLHLLTSKRAFTEEWNSGFVSCHSGRPEVRDNHDIVMAQGIGPNTKERGEAPRCYECPTLVGASSGVSGGNRSSYEFR